MITKSEWLKALGEAEAPSLPNGQSIKEIARMMGISESSAKRRITRLKEQGKVICGVKIINGIKVKSYTLKGGKL